MQHSNKSLGKAAVYAGLTLGLVLGGAGVVIANPTLAAAAVITSDQAAQISVPNATLSDAASQGQPFVYGSDTVPNNGAPVWTDFKNGSVTSYYSVVGKDGKTYYSYSGDPAGVNRFILDLDTFKPDTLELHVVWKQGAQETQPYLYINWGPGSASKTLKTDPNRDLIVRSASGTQYKPYLGLSNGTNIFKIIRTTEIEKTPEYSQDKVATLQFNANADRFKANDTVEIVIPLTATAGQNVTDASKDAIQVQDLLTRKTAGVAVVSAHKVYDRAYLKKIELIPSVYAGYDEKNQYWDARPELADCFPSPDINSGVLDIAKMDNYAQSSQELDALSYGHVPDTIYSYSSWCRFDLAEIEKKLTQVGWTVEFRADGNPAPHYTYAKTSVPAVIDGHDANSVTSDVTKNTTFATQVSVIPALIRADAQHYKVGELPADWSEASLLKTVYKADYQTDGLDENLKTLDQLEVLDKDAEVKDGTIKLSYQYRALGTTDDAFEAADKVDGTKAGVYKVTFTRIYGNSTPISTYQYVYIDDAKTESKTITRTINVHQPDGKTVPTKQTVTFTRTTTTDAQTGETSVSDWKAEGAWSAFTAPEVEGWTATNTVDAAEVTLDTPDATEDIFYTKLPDPETPDPETPTTTDPTTDNPATTDLATNPGDKNGSGTSATNPANNQSTSVRETSKIHTPKTGDAALAVAPVAATGIVPLLGSFIARKRRK